MTNRLRAFGSTAVLALALANASAQQSPGYTFYSQQNTSTAVLLDTNGATYHSWTFTGNGKTGYSSYLMPGGKVFRGIAHTGNAINGGGVTGEVQEADWNGNLLWTYVYSSSTYVLHHDICPLANGNVLMIAYEVKTAADATDAGASQAISVQSEKIIEVQPTGTSGGTIVWEWHLWDHLSQNYNAAKNNYVASISAHPELMNINYSLTQDWVHMNGIDYNPTLDQIVVSSHNLNEMWVIDHSTTTAQAASHSGGNAGKGGDFLYRWGNPATYGAGTAANKILNVVHDAHWIPAGVPHAGYIVGFNNNGVSNSQSSIDFVDAPHNGNNYTLSGTAYSPATYTKRLPCTGHTNDMGNSQQLPNGNSLICVAQTGLVYEVDSNNVTLWSKTASGTVPNAFRYTACYISGTQPATPTATISGAALTSSAGAIGTTYQWYNNGVAIAGATSQTYTATAAGSYTVVVSDSYTCASNPSVAIAYAPGGTGVNTLSAPKLMQLYPNPTNGIVNVIMNQRGDYTVAVYDAYGKMLRSVKNATMISLADYSTGVYYITVKMGDATAVERISVII